MFLYLFCEATFAEKTYQYDIVTSCIVNKHFLFLVIFYSVACISHCNKYNRVTNCVVFTAMTNLYFLGTNICILAIVTNKEVYCSNM